jgi:hypothetical protein
LTARRIANDQQLDRLVLADVVPQAHPGQHSPLHPLP